MWQTQWIGIRNYRMWCMVATYGFCFGVELTMNNIVAGRALHSPTSHFDLRRLVTVTSHQKVDGWAQLYLGLAGASTRPLLRST